MTDMWVPAYFPIQVRKLRQIVKGLQICEAHKRKGYVDTERNPKCNVNRNAKKQNE